MTVQNKINVINASTNKDILPKSALKGYSNFPNINPLDLIKNKVQSGIEDSFLVADLGEVYRALKLWKEHLPDVVPFYAVKSNSDLTILKFMIDLGMSFDCASKKEIETILALGGNPENIIYANPCKQPNHVRFAKSKGVLKTTFDNLDELHKTKELYPNAELFLRILPLDKHSMLPFGEKYGARVGDISLELLREARELGLNVCGISFHVGTDCFEPEGFCETIKRARMVFDQAKALGHSMTTLDIGGGFPGAQHRTTFIKLASSIKDALNTYFAGEDLKFIAEPGRYFSSPIMTLATSVIGKRKYLNEQNKTNIMYYLTDGVFKSFTETAFVPDRFVRPQLLQPKLTELTEFSLWGPTLCSPDKIRTPKGMQLPELKLGDWLYFENMGAYSICFNMEFNGFEQSPILYVNTEYGTI